MIEASLFAAAITPEEADRIGVYVLAGLVGLVVTGLIACAKRLRAEVTRRD